MRSNRDMWARIRKFMHAHFIHAMRIARAEFLALVLVSLMILHKAEGAEMEDAMKEVAKRAQTTGDDQLSAQVCGFAVE